MTRLVAAAAAWAPDGRQIAFARVRDEGESYRTEIVVASIDDGTGRVLVSQRVDDRCHRLATGVVAGRNADCLHASAIRS